MIDLGVIISILTIHFIADFIMQSDWMAKNKSSDYKALISHVIVYGYGLFGCIIGMMLMKGFAVSYLIWVFVNTILHGITDFYTSRINKKLWESGNTHNFFVGVGADQLIHYLTLFLTWILIIG